MLRLNKKQSSSLSFILVFESQVLAYKIAQKSWQMPTSLQRTYNFFPEHKPKEQVNVAKGVQYRTEASDYFGNFSATVQNRPRKGCWSEAAAATEEGRVVERDPTRPTAFKKGRMIKIDRCRPHCKARTVCLRQDLFPRKGRPRKLYTQPYLIRNALVELSYYIYTYSLHYAKFH